MRHHGPCNSHHRRFHQVRDGGGHWVIAILALILWGIWALILNRPEGHSVPPRGLQPSANHQIIRE